MGIQIMTADGWRTMDGTDTVPPSTHLNYDQANGERDRKFLESLSSDKFSDSYRKAMAANIAAERKRHMDAGTLFRA